MSNCSLDVDVIIIYNSRTFIAVLDALELHRLRSPIQWNRTLIMFKIRVSWWRNKGIIVSSPCHNGDDRAQWEMSWWSTAQSIVRSNQWTDRLFISKLNRSRERSGSSFLASAGSMGAHCHWCPSQKDAGIILRRRAWTRLDWQGACPVPAIAPTCRRKTKSTPPLQVRPRRDPSCPAREKTFQTSTYIKNSFTWSSCWWNSWSFRRCNARRDPLGEKRTR